MQSGSLADWVTGIGELLAVSVALFLPYFNRRKTIITWNTRAKKMILRSVKKIIKVNGTDDIQTNEDFENLSLFVEVYSIIATSASTINIITYGDEILDIIGDSSKLSDLQIKEIQKKITDLKTGKQN
ncbi:hypothetical protein [Companilactobacillus sp. HBUAS59699]|uniref:hypothetical protein n=1 Tax=Companilactobacillus sp. HBUAS59699 TaxID=3109358 RepID=UPI002FF2D0F4